MKVLIEIDEYYFSRDFAALQKMRRSMREFVNDMKYILHDEKLQELHKYVRTLEDNFAYLELIDSAEEYEEEKKWFKNSLIGL